MASKSHYTGKEKARRKDEEFTCPECGGHQVVQDTTKGDKVCVNCGLVVSDKRIDMGPDWRAFTAEERNTRARAGAPTTYTIHDKGLTTRIGWQDRDSKGKRFSPKRRAEIYRLRKWQIRSRVHSGAERNLAQAMTEMDRLTSQLGLSRSIKELAAMLYRKLIVKRLVRSRSIDAMVAASIYAACRLRKTPRSLREIARYSRVSKKKIGQHYRLIIRKLKLRMPIADPVTYVPRMITELGLSGEVQQKVIKILKQAKKKHRLVMGRDPRGIAAAAIYIASILTDNPVTQREIATVAGITEVTVRNRYKEIVRKLEITMEF
jgi:transcription initiation factor TFIIB